MKIKFITTRDNLLLRETRIDGETKNLMFALENFLSDYSDLDLFENKIELGFAELVKFIASETGCFIKIEG